MPQLCPQQLDLLKQRVSAQGSAVKEAKMVRRKRRNLHSGTELSGPLAGPSCCHCDLSSRVISQVLAEDDVTSRGQLSSDHAGHCACRQRQPTRTTRRWRRQRRQKSTSWWRSRRRSAPPSPGALSCCEGNATAVHCCGPALVVLSAFRVSASKSSPTSYLCRLVNDNWTEPL